MTAPAWRRLAIALVVALLGGGGAPAALAHSASDAYLTIKVPAAPSAGAAAFQATGQWDVALRDLDFVLALDDNGDGNITWAELRGHQAAIAAYAMDRLKLAGDGRPCSLKLTRQQVDDHADGTYAVLSFDVRCAARPRRLTLDYRLFFDIDPSHRAIFAFDQRGALSTALLSPQHATIDLALDADPAQAAAAVPGRN